MKKIFVILVSLILVIVITGCSNQQKITQMPPAEQTQNSNSTEQMSDAAIPGDALTYLSSRVITNEDLFVTEATKNIYASYSKSQNDELLKGLNPLDIFRLFNQACEDNNFEMQAALIELPTEITRKQFIQEISDDKVSQEIEKKELEAFHKFDGKLIERVVDNKKAYIIIEKKGWYRMEKDRNGIWKLGWLARQ